MRGARRNHLVVDLFEYTPISYECADNDKPRLVYSENDPILKLPEKTLIEIEKINEKGDSRFLDIGRDKIKPRNLVGVLSFRDITFQIFPKLMKGSKYSELEGKKDVIMKNLLKMLLIAEEVPIKEADIANIREEQLSDFLEILVSIFAHKLYALLRNHRYYRYEVLQDDLKCVRGRIEFSKYMRRPERKHIVPCAFNERTLSNILNITLKYTSYLLMLHTTSMDNYRTLKAILEILDSVPLRPVTLQEVDRIHFNRLNRVFKPLIELAKLFLKKSIIKPQHSRIETFTFLIPMEDLFEKFVANLIIKYKRDIFSELSGNVVEVEYQHNIGSLLTDKFGRTYFNLRPDLTIEIRNLNSGRVEKKYVVDMKYKLLDKNKRNLEVAQSDIYQMYAYATKWNADGVLLIYPTIEDANDIRADWYFKVETNGTEKKIPLFVRTLNLSYDFKNEWEKLIDDLRRHLIDLVGT